MSLKDHLKYFNEKSVDRMCPGEVHAYYNATSYRVQNFKGEGFFDYVGDFARLADAISNAVDQDRPLIYCVSQRSHEECMLLIPLNLPRRFPKC